MGTNNLSTYENKFRTNLRHGRLKSQHIGAEQREVIDVEFKVMHSWS